MAHETTNPLFLPGGDPLPALPRVHSEKNERWIRGEYDAALGKRLPEGHEHLSIHQSVLGQNLEKRIKQTKQHIDTASRRDALICDVIRLGRIDDPLPRTIAFTNTLKSMSSLEIGSQLEAGDQPISLDVELAERAFKLIEVAHEMGDVQGDLNTDPLLRTKAIRFIKDKDSTAVVVTSKASGYTLTTDDEVIECKSRQSGFVLLEDEQLVGKERKALMILASMSRDKGSKISQNQNTNGAVRGFDEVMLNALTTKDIFHPTISVSYLARHIKQDQ